VKNILSKVFANDKFYFFMTLISVIGGTYFAFSQIFVWHGYDILSAYTLLIRVLCVIVLYISYKRHSKNVMKGMMSALLMAQMLGALSWTRDLSSESSVTDIIFITVFVASAILLFINHFIINESHHSRPVHIFFNQIFCILMSVDNFIWDLIWLPYITDTVEISATIVDMISFPCLIATVICVESRLDAYRIIRENEL